MALIDQYGTPIRTQDLTREIAAPTLTGVRTIWTNSVASGLTPERLASMLRNAQDGDHYDYLTLAEEMEERDLHYASELSKRKLAVSRLPLTVESASDAQRDIDLADTVRSLVKSSGFRFMIKDLLDGLGKGFSVCEIDWDRTGKTWLPRGYPWRDPRFFQFDPVSRARIRLRDEGNLMEGVELPPYKFIIHVPKIKSGLPIRGGLARLAAWAFMCKGYTVKDWMAFAEVFGMPMRLGKYSAGATPAEIAVLRMAVANLGSDAAAVFPESMQIELKEASKGSSNDFYKMLAEFLDAQVSKGVLGQTASASGTAGRLGDDKLQAEVRDDIRDDDAEQLEDTLNRDLVRPFVDLNFGPQQAYPVVQLRAPKAEDVAALVDALAKLVPVGLRVEQSVVRDKLGLPDPDRNAKPEDLLGAAPQTPGQAANRRQKSCPHCAPALNRESHGAPLDMMAGYLAERADAPMTAWIQQLRALTNQAGSLEDLREMVLEAFPGMDVGPLAVILAEEAMRAEMIGRSDVSDGE